MNKYKISPVVIIVAGSFSGKSIIANHLANKYLFSGVVCTDLIRNFLLIQTKDKDIFSTSTYRMSKKDLAIQKGKVSEIVRQMIDIYRNRGEKIIIEGMHFSEAFLTSIRDKNYLLIALNNQLTVAEKIASKRLTTRPGIRGKTSEQEQRIDEIHNELLACCRKNNFNIIEFSDIAVAKNQCEELVEDYLRFLED